MSLCNCALSDGNALDIAHMLTANAVLAKLVLDENGIGDTGLTHIADALRQNSTLVKLSMNNNYVHESGVFALGTACRRQCALRSVSLLENYLTPLAAIELARAAAVNTVLVALQLSWCVVSAHEVGAFRHWRAMSQANSALRTLTLLNTPLLLNHCLERGAALLDKHSLTAVNLNHCSVHPPDMAYVAKFVADNAVLLTLDVSENHMLDAGASELAAALRQNTKLQSLALRDNGLTGAGLWPVFDAVIVFLFLCGPAQIHAALSRHLTQCQKHTWAGPDKHHARLAGPLHEPPRLAVRRGRRPQRGLRGQGHAVGEHDDDALVYGLCLHLARAGLGAGAGRGQQLFTQALYVFGHGLF